MKLDYERVFIPHYKDQVISAILKRKPHYTGLTKRPKRQLIAIYLNLIERSKQ